MLADVQVAQAQGGKQHFAKNLARQDMIILLVVSTRCSIDYRTSKWFGYFNEKWLFAQVHFSVMLFHRNQRQSMMKSAYAEEEKLCMKKIRVYRNADCAKCARFAKVGLFF